MIGKWWVCLWTPYEESRYFGWWGLPIAGGSEPAVSSSSTRRGPRAGCKTASNSGNAFALTRSIRVMEIVYFHLFRSLGNRPALCTHWIQVTEFQGPNGRTSLGATVVGSTDGVYRSRLEWRSISITWELIKIAHSRSFSSPNLLNESISYLEA